MKSNLFATGMIVKLEFADVKRLHGHKRLQEDFVTDDHLVANGAQLVERLHDKPRALAARAVQVDAHGVAFHVRRQFLVHREELVTLDVQELDNAPVLDECALIDQLARFHFVLPLL